MKDKTIEDLKAIDVRLVSRCAECGAVLVVGHRVDEARMINDYIPSVDGSREYCLKCAAEFANQRDLEE